MTTAVAAAAATYHVNENIVRTPNEVWPTSTSDEKQLATTHSSKQ